MIKRGSFIVFLFLFEDVLSKINILSNHLQQKQATLGKAVNLVNGVIKTFENNRTDESFNGVWTEISSYAKKLDISLEIGLYNLNFYAHAIPCYNFLFFLHRKGSKTKRKKNEPTNFKDYYVFSKTENQCSYKVMNDNMTEEKETSEHWKINAYFRVLDCMTVGLKKRFSKENLDIGIAVDHFLKLNYEDSIIFIEKYEVRVFKLNTFGYSISMIQCYFLYYLFSESIMYQSNLFEIRNVGC